jgi:FkbM family methyltransferase
MRAVAKKLIKALGLEGSRSRKLVFKDIQRIDPTASLIGKQVKSLGLTFDPIAESWITHSISMIGELKSHCGFQFEKRSDHLFATSGKNQFVVQSAIEVGIIYDVFGRNVYRLITDKPVTIIDVGANIGIASVYFASELKARVYGFELVPAVAARAQEHIAICGLTDQVTVIACGLGKATMEIEVPFSEELTGNTSLHWEVESRPTTKNVQCKVQSVGEALNPILSEAKTSIFMKLDCEGAEYEILEAMADENLLSKISGFMIEYHELSPQRNRLWIEEFLTAHGFTSIALQRPSANHDMIYTMRNSPGTF